MRTAVWFSNYGVPKPRLEYPYKAQSPVTGKKKDFESFKDVWYEIDKLLKETEGKKYSIGQSLYYQLPFFCNPSEVISQWCWDMITDYFTVRNYNVPLADNLDNVNPYILDCFAIIQNELNNINKHEREK